MPISGSQVALMYARSSSPTGTGTGLFRPMRSGASRSDYYNPFMPLSVNGVRRDQNYDLLSVEIEDIINEQPDTLTLVTHGFAVTEGQPIVLGIGAISNRLFGGTVVRVEQAHEKLTERGNRFRLLCVDGTYLLDRRLVNKAYASQSVSTIVTDVMTTYTTGFTTTNVQAGLANYAIEFTMESVSGALTRLANLVGGYWYVDYSSDLHFFTAETTQLPTALTNTNRKFRDFRYSRDLTQIRTRVSVEGGGGVTTAAVAVGATSIPVDETAWYSGTGGSLKARGGQIVTYTGRSTSSGAGNLTGVPASGTGSVLTALNVGDEVNLFVTRNDTTAQTALAALEGGDGIHEHFFQDRRLSIAGAEARADAELTLFKNVAEDGSYVTEDKFTKSGKNLTVTMNGAGEWGISGTYKIQKVTIRMDESRSWPQRHVVFSAVHRTLYHILRAAQEGRKDLQ